MAVYIHKRKQVIEDYKTFVNAVIKELARKELREFEEVLKRSVTLLPEVECFYVVDMAGIMVTNTIFTPEMKSKISPSPLFEPASVGKSLFCKEYIYPLISGIFPTYVTEPYVSLATGNMVITISKTFRNIQGRDYILCADFRPKHSDSF